MLSWLTYIKNGERCVVGNVVLVPDTVVEDEVRVLVCAESVLLYSEEETDWSSGV